MESNTELTAKQYAAIKRAISLGKTLQDEQTEIPNLWRSGKSLANIVFELNIDSRYNVTKKIALNGVYYALAGYEINCPDIGDQYTGLIGKEERKKIAKDHRIEFAKDQGLQLYNEGRGIFGIDPRTGEQYIVEARRKGGGVAGKKCYEEKKGMFARSQEEWKEDSKRAGSLGGMKSVELGMGVHAVDSRTKKLWGKKSVELRGETPYTSEEIEYVFYLSNLSEYQRRTKSNISRIAEEVNIKYHDRKQVRDGKSISRMILKAKRSRGKEVKSNLEWTKEEIEFAYKLSLDENYSHRNGGVFNKKIALEINATFHNNEPVRTSNSVEGRLIRYRKSLETKI